MKKEVKHYGKTLSELNNNEVKLLMIDTEMTLLFKVQKELGEKIPDELKERSSQLTEQRLKQTILCLGWGLVELLTYGESVIEEVEKSVYSYRQFMKDMKVNSKIVLDELTQSILN